MKRPLSTLLLALALLVATSAQAQEHQHQPADTTRAMPMDHGQMDGMDHSGMDMEAMMPRMMAMHERMMADPEMHERMMDNPEMRPMMQETMGGEMDMAAMRERMAAMSPDERQDHMRQMHAAMMERMASMDPERRRAMHERMMADPEMRQMMESMHGEGRMRDGMDHGQMDHGLMDGMDHSNSEGATQGMNHSEMDPSQMVGMDHAAGVAIQRRNAGASNGDVRPATSAVGPEAFDASATANRFHAALASGDRSAMEALLLPDAVVLEGGAHEARAEYLSHHFARDAEFLSGTTPEPLFRRTTVAGDAAWVASTQQIRDTEMAELLVMKQTPGGWRIAAVHWSSAR